MWLSYNATQYKILYDRYRWFELLYSRSISIFRLCSIPSPSAPAGNSLNQIRCFAYFTYEWQILSLHPVAIEFYDAFGYVCFNCLPVACVLNPPPPQ